jgi:multicomponent Na+:H+ antiporter subunit D
VVTQTELLFYSALAFTLLLLSGIYPAEMRAVNIDFDWFYRKPLNAFVNGIALFLNGLNRTMDRLLVRELTGAVNEVATNAMAIVAWAIMSPFVKKDVPLDPGQVSLKTRVDLAFATGTSPVGLFAAWAGLFIVMLFVFI